MPKVPRPPKGSMRGGVVRLTLPARLANDLDGLQTSLKDLAERLGHPSCATGCDVLFIQLEREFIRVGDQTQAHAGEGFLPSDPVPLRPVDVRLAPGVSNSIESLQQAVAATVGKLGCKACCSGFDIAFRRELDMISINEKLEVQGFGSYR
jgi:hypothetical protein